MAAWRVAQSLLVLRDQVDAMYPARSRSSDGTIGDAAHAGTTSDHNPDSGGVVRAMDLTHDPAHGADMGRLAEALRVSRDPRIKYVIFSRRIFSATASPWTWRTYTGSNPHDHHMHVSVVGDDRADSTTRWIGDDDVSQHTDHVIHAWSQGLSKASDGTSVEPVKWRQRDEAWQSVVAQQLDQLVARPAGTLALTASDRAAIVADLAASLDARIEAAIRRVLGGLDGATPSRG